MNRYEEPGKQFSIVKPFWTALSQDFLFSSRFLKLYQSVHLNKVFSLSLHPIPSYLSIYLSIDLSIYLFPVSLCFLFHSYLLIFSLCVAFTFLSCFLYLFTSLILFHYLPSLSLCLWFLSMHLIYHSLYLSYTHTTTMRHLLSLSHQDTAIHLSLNCIKTVNFLS